MKKWFYYFHSVSWLYIIYDEREICVFLICHVPCSTGYSIIWSSQTVAISHMLSMLCRPQVAKPCISNHLHSNHVVGVLNWRFNINIYRGTTFTVYLICKSRTNKTGSTLEARIVSYTLIVVVVMTMSFILCL